MIGLRFVAFTVWVHYLIGINAGMEKPGIYLGAVV